MDVIKVARGRIISAIAVVTWFAIPAHADTRNFALVRCDETAGELVVSEAFTEDGPEAYRAPEGFQSKWMDQLVEYISPPGGASDSAVQGTYRHKTGEWKLKCTLMGKLYNVVISPWSVNDMVMGQCGAGDPDVELTVLRDKRMLVRKLRLGGDCSIAIAPIATPTMGTIKFVEPEQIAILDEKKIPYSDLPMLDKGKAK